VAVAAATSDGARIRFEARGYGTRPSPSDPAWRVAATLHFTTDDRNGPALGTWFT